MSSALISRIHHHLPDYPNTNSNSTASPAPSGRTSMAGTRRSSKRKPLVLTFFGLLFVVSFFYIVTLLRYDEWKRHRSYHTGVDREMGQYLIGNETLLKTPNTSKSKAFHHVRAPESNTTSKSHTEKYLNMNKTLYTTPKASKRKAFIHVGIPKSGTTTIQNAIYRDRMLLASDGFNYAVNEVSGNNFNIGRLGNCLWTKEGTQKALKNIGSSIGKCPPTLLRQFQNLLKRTKAQSRNLVVSHEWLSVESSEYGLDDLFDSDWKVIIVIYYRNYYDWIISKHFQWRQHQHRGLRLIDFVRSQCKNALYYTGDMNPHNASVLAALQPNGYFASQTYAYAVTKRYESVPRFKDNIILVNMHQGDPVKNLYCEVMKANNTCASISANEKQLKMRTKDSVSLVYEDLVLGAFQNGTIQRKLPPDRFLGEVKYWANLVSAHITSLLGGENKTVADLPFECLSREEHERLLQISEIYEQLLAPYMIPLPNKMASSINHTNTICSVKVDEVLMRTEWKEFFKKHSS